MASDPFNPGRETSVTMKQHGGFDASWLVFRGSPSEIKEQIAESFGYERADVTDLDLVSLVNKATVEFQATRLVTEKLGGKPAAKPRAKPKAEKPSGDDEPPWSPPTAAELGWDDPPTTAETPVDPKVKHLAAPEAVVDVDSLKLYWANNQAAFADPELMAAYKARGKALKDGGK